MKSVILTLAMMASVTLGYSANKENSGKKNHAVETTQTPAESENASISLSGKVVDFTSGESLTGVEVAIEGLDHKVYTDFDGNFRFENLTPGEYNIIASFISYNKSYVEKFDAGKGHETVNIKLQSSL